MLLRRVRRRNVQVGLGSSVGVLVANAIYFLSTPDGPNRPQLWLLQALAISIGCVVVAGTGRRWFPVRTVVVLMIWAGSQTAIIGLAAALDGGLTSPMVELLFIPLLVGAMAFRPAVVAAHTAASLGVLVLVGAATGTLAVGTVAIGAILLASLAAVTSSASQSLYRLTRRLDEANRELEHLAHTDGLTGCLNHRALHAQLGAELARAERAGEPTCLLMLDVDHFKRINDVHGHPVGDEVLVAIASALRGELRVSDVLGRTGGEEFAVLLPQTDVAAGVAIGERLRSTVAASATPAPVTVSIGVAVTPLHGRSAASLVRAADAALYAAKRTGRDRLVVATPDDATSTSDRDDDDATSDRDGAATSTSPALPGGGADTVARRQSWDR